MKGRYNTIHFKGDFSARKLMKIGVIASFRLTIFNHWFLQFFRKNDLLKKSKNLQTTIF